MQNMKNQRSGNVPPQGSIASAIMNMNRQAQAGMQPSLQPQQINPLASAIIRMNNHAQGGTMQAPRPQYQNLMPFLSGGGALGGFGGGSPMMPSYGFSSAMNQGTMQQRQAPMPLMVGGNNGPLSAPQQQQFNNFQSHQQQSPQSAIQFLSRSGSR